MALSVPPVADPDTAPYWEAARGGRLVAQRCADCRARRFPPSPICDTCRSTAFTWAELPATALLYPWVVVHQQILPEFADVPYVVGLAEFEPRIRIPGRVIVEDPARCRDRLPLRVRFRDWGDGAVVPEFEAILDEEGTAS